MSIFLRAATVIILGALLSACGGGSSTAQSHGVIHLSATPANAAETINGTAVPTTLLDAVAKGRGLDLHVPEQRQKALAEVSQYVLLAQQAKKLNLLQQPDLAAMVEAARLQGVANAALLAYGRSHPISDAMVAKDYADQVKEVGDKTYRFTQLLFADKATADKAAAELVAGKSYSDVFDAYRSKARDAQSYPEVFPKQLPPPLALALTSLKPGQATKVPVKSKLGWHLLHLEGVNPFHAPPLAKVKDQVRSNLEKRQVAAYIESLKTNAKISVSQPAHAISVAAQSSNLRKAPGRIVNQSTPA
ncbi:MAG: peptidyl-prolyl cis-trans isomerase, partial [Xanthomonadales bacterium]|nr:peptidyl-prolyl cis-trans isomerase [Xanthomonadales bacterium]